MNDEKIEKTIPQNSFKLYSGEYLSSQTSVFLTSQFLCKIIIVAGLPEAGKTTLLAYLNNAFQRGPFEDFYFAGSYTLLSFEKCAHLSRITSGKSKPDTERTKYTDELNFLHLQLNNGDHSKRTNILITDLSGERFRIIKDSSDECKKFDLLKRCDSFTMLIDGEKLLGLDTRHQCKYDNLRLLRNCVDSQMLGKDSNVLILFSKWDLIDQSQEDAKEFVNSIKKEIEEKYSLLFNSLILKEICAQSQNNGTIKTGLNINEVLKNWIDGPGKLGFSEFSKNKLIKSDREFSRFNHKKI